MAETTKKSCEKLKWQWSTVKDICTRTINKITENLEKEKTVEVTTLIEFQELHKQLSNILD